MLAEKRKGNPTYEPQLNTHILTPKWPLAQFFKNGQQVWFVIFLFQERATSVRAAKKNNLTDRLKASLHFLSLRRHNFTSSEISKKQRTMRKKQRRLVITELRGRHIGPRDEAL